MPIGKVRLFSSSPEDVKSFGGFNAVDIFNDGIIPAVADLFPEEVTAGEDPLDIGNYNSDLPIRQNNDSMPDVGELLARRSQPRSFAPDESAPAAGAPAPPSREPASNGSRDLMSLVKSFEGFYKEPYADYKQTSIGYGTRAKPGEKSITKEEAEARLSKELGVSRNRVLEHASTHGYQFNQAQIDALTSFDYNTGRLEQLTNNGTRSPAEIAAKLPLYRKAGGKVLPGLEARRAAEQRLFQQR